jgi:Icc protein
MSYDLVLLTGDLAEDGSEDAYRFLRWQLGLLEIPCYCLPGNHDDSAAMSQFLAGDNVHMGSRIVLDHWQIVCLDSTVAGESGGFLPDSQIILLQDAMVSEPHKHLLIALHHHPIPCGSVWMDTMMVRNSERLLAVLDRMPAQARVVIFGHIHQAFDLELRGVRFLGSPSTCFQFKPRSQNCAIAPCSPGYRWINITDAGDMLTGSQFVSGG